MYKLIITICYVTAIMASSEFQLPSISSVNKNSAVPAAPTPSPSAYNNELTSTFEKQSSFPLLPSTEIQSLPTIYSNTPLISASQLEPLSLITFENIYLAFSSTMAKAFSITATRLYAELNQIDSMSKIQRLYAIPNITNIFIPMFNTLSGLLNLNGVNFANIAVTNVTQQSAAYIYCPPKILSDYIQSMQTTSNGANQVAQYLYQLNGLIGNLLQNLQLSPAQKSIIFTTSIQSAMENNFKQIALGNDEIQNGFESIVTHGLPLMHYQTSKCSINFLGAKFTWLNQINAVFNQMNPIVNDFAAAFLKDGKRSASTNTCSVKISKINYQIKTTVSKLAHYIRILGDYFELYNRSVKYLQQKQNK